MLSQCQLCRLVISATVLNGLPKRALQFRALDIPLLELDFVVFFGLLPALPLFVVEFPDGSQVDAVYGGLSLTAIMLMSETGTRPPRGFSTSMLPWTLRATATSAQ